MPRSHRIALATALLGVAAAGFAPTASAQTSASASINAVAHVLGVAPLTATGVNDLNFGNVTAGTPKSPSSLAADAGRFNISGQPSAPVTVSFALPTVLTGAGSSTIPITFGGTDGILWTSFPVTSSTFNPNAPFFTTLSGAGNLVIGISGTVTPGSSATTGNYTGTITMTVAY